ncbi:hypothetical protein [Streptomyces sp. NPDC059894]|uniref:hypothetical protein n=1 Tax=unclassified Streptomyces TaxID=2593676 RepID=UPI003663F133
MTRAPLGVVVVLGVVLGVVIVVVIVIVIVIVIVRGTMEIDTMGVNRKAGRSTSRR